MRRIILGIALALCALPSVSQTFAQCPATMFTPNLGLALPPRGTQNWNLCLNPNFQIIDTAIARLQSPFLGPWSSSTVYTKGVFVSFNNAIYISSFSSNFNNTPAPDSPAWQLFFSISGGGSITAPASGWPAWLVPAIVNSVLSVTASPIPNEALAHSSININGQDMSLGGTYTIGGAGGGCGPVSGDTSSVDCGTNNNTGANYNGAPNNIQTYGLNLNNGAAGQTGVSIGNDNGTNATFNQTTVIGEFNYSNNDPTAGLFGIESVFIGSANAEFLGGEGSGVGASFSDSLGIGARNYQQFNNSAFGSYTNAFALGFQNLANENGNVVPGNFRDVVALGDATANSLHGSTDVVAVGDAALSGGNTNPGPSYSDVVAIGDVAASLPPDGSSTLIAIGLCPMCIGDTGSGITGPLTESIAIGDEAVDAGANGAHDLIGIGDEAMFGPHGAGNFTDGNDDIAIGNFAGAAFRHGSENIALGTNACAVNYGSNDGNSNTDGNEQICIGDNAGQSVSNTTHLNDIIVIGDHAQVAQSNSAALGSQATIFDTHLFGTIHSTSATSPTASAGTLVGTNNGGAISGLSAATSVTVTFAGGTGFTVWNSCTANASAASTPVAVSALSLTSVTFSFPSLTGSLYFHCDGN